MKRTWRPVEPRARSPDEWGLGGAREGVVWWGSAGRRAVIEAGGCVDFVGFLRGVIDP